MHIYIYIYIFVDRARLSCTLDNTGVIRFPQNCRACPAQIEFLLIKTGISVACVFSPPLPPLISLPPTPSLPPALPANARVLPFRPPRLRGLLSLSPPLFARPPRSLSLSLSGARARATATFLLVCRCNPPRVPPPCPVPRARSISLSPCQSTATYKFIALIKLKYGIGYVQSL